MTSTRDALAALPSHCVRSLAPLRADELQRWAGQSGQRYVEIDVAGLAGKTAVLTAIGRALGFPPWYGANLDALYDCLTDLAEHGDAGWLIVLLHLSAPGVLEAEERAALLDVFGDATEAFADQGVGLRVFHSP